MCKEAVEKKPGKKSWKIDSHHKQILDTNTTHMLVLNRLVQFGVVVQKYKVLKNIILW